MWCLEVSYMMLKFKSEGLTGLLLDMMALMVVFELDDIFGKFYIQMYVKKDEHGKKLAKEEDFL